MPKEASAVRVDERRGLKTTSNTDCLFDAYPFCPCSRKGSKHLIRPSNITSGMHLKRCSFDPKMQLCAFSYIACHMTCLPVANSKRPLQETNRKIKGRTCQFSMMTNLELQLKIFLTYRGCSYLVIETCPGGKT